MEQRLQHNRETEALKDQVELYLVVAPLSHPGMEGLWTGDQGCFCLGGERFRDVPDLDGAVLAAGHYKAFLQPERNETIKCRETVQGVSPP